MIVLEALLVAAAVGGVLRLAVLDARRRELRLATVPVRRNNRRSTTN